MASANPLISPSSTKASLQTPFYLKLVLWPLCKPSYISQWYYSFPTGTVISHNSNTATNTSLYLPCYINQWYYGLSANHLISHSGTIASLQTMLKLQIVLWPPCKPSNISQWCYSFPISPSGTGPVISPHGTKASLQTL